MLLRKFPQAIAACLVITLWCISSFAQSGDARSRLIAQNTDGVSYSPDDPIIISTANPTDSKPAPKPVIDLSGGVKSISTNFLNAQPLLLAAIDQRLGAPYSWGATGPRAFDCSGFVWSIFQSAGINFERGSARTLFARFEPVAPEEQYRFGTLVFFSGLAHVGVVADEHGFYHASRHHGVIYSPFNEYWLKRIDGFRRVPLPTVNVTD